MLTSCNGVGDEPKLGRKARVIRIFAIAHRREVYEEAADRLRQGREQK